MTIAMLLRNTLTAWRMQHGARRPLIEGLSNQ
jgi:hypothetical protein